MRPDVKLGVAISLVIVLVAGGYYMYRDYREVPIPVSGDTLASVNATSGQTKIGIPDTKREARRPDSTRRQRQPRRKSTGDGMRTRPAPARSTTGRADRSAPKRSATQSKEGAGSNAPARSPTPRQAGRTPKSAVPDAKRTAPATRRQPTRKVTDASGRSRSKPAPAARGPHVPATAPPRSSPRSTAATKAAKAPDVTASKPAADSPDVAVDTHRVQAGDSFASLAKCYYGHEKYTRLLIDSNPQIRDPNRLRVGVTIRIPPASSDSLLLAEGAHAEKSASIPNVSAGPRTYTAKPGDSFYGIAHTVLGDASRWHELLALNKDAVSGDPKRLQIGQVLTLPD